MSSPFEPRLWGKERHLPHPYPLGCHAIDAGTMVGALWDRYLTKRQRRIIASGWCLTQRATRQLISVLAALHDLGKVTPGFQGCEPRADQLTGLPGYEPLPVDGRRLSHQRAVHLALPELLHRRHGIPLSGRPTRSVAHQLAQILGGHHGTYPEALSHQGNQLACPLVAVPELGGNAWDEQREHLLHLVETIFGTPQWPTEPAPAPVAVLTTGLVTLADWLVSQIPFIRARQRQWDADPTSSWASHAARTRRAAPAALRAAQLTPPRWHPTTSFTELFPHLKGQRLHPIQTSLAQALPTLVKGPGLLLVTAPPGEGKTEAALYAERIMGPAAGTTGLAFLLPTMATTDAMWRRVRHHTQANCVPPPPVTLLHSLAWLDADYAPDDLRSATNEPDIVAEWLRGRHRGLLAGVTVGTWDQAALAVLPHRYMTLRWLGLSGKTVIIDEVHAYDAHGHALTLRLLQWLGALGVPVILMSATVTGDTAAALVHAYRSGAGHSDTPALTPTYPGWTYVDHATGTLTQSQPLGSHRAHDLTIDAVHCAHTHDPEIPDGRAAALLHHLAPLTDHRAGCALIICNTVADAQETHRLLTEAWATNAVSPLVRILHARMPARQRAAITRRLTRWTGPRGTRPARPFVVVTTQVAEQSLDVDFDLVISDLAPLALLLQRAGRGHRHAHTQRPAWATGHRLIVLAPTGSLPPRAWGSVYDPSLLRRTNDLLTQLDRPVNVPDDVQDLVDSVYGPEFAGTDDLARLADTMARASLADAADIKPPHLVRDLHPLTNSDQHPDLIATRLGSDTVRVLPTYTTRDGRHWLHPSRHTQRTALPHHVSPRDKATIRRLMRATLPINAQWLTRDNPETAPPPTWSDIPALRDVALLPHPVTETTIFPNRTGTATLRINPETGLHRT